MMVMAYWDTLHTILVNMFFQVFHVFVLYIFQDAKTEWSQALWVDLNIQLLQEGVEGFIKSLRQLPKDVRGLPVAFFLDGRMKEFRESLPLLLDLKNEALRDRSEPNWHKTPKTKCQLINMKYEYEILKMYVNQVRNI